VSASTVSVGLLHQLKTGNTQHLMLQTNIKLRLALQ